MKVIPWVLPRVPQSNCGNTHQSNLCRVGICIYFEENLPIKRRKDLEIMQETIVCEISLRRKKIFL